MSWELHTNNLLLGKRHYKQSVKKWQMGENHCNIYHRKKLMVLLCKELLKIGNRSSINPREKQARGKKINK